MASTSVNLGGYNSAAQVIATYWEAVSAASGTIQIPSGSQILIDTFQGLEDALVSQISSGKPTFDAAVDGSSNRVSTTFDTSGNYSLSATPSSYPVAIIFRVLIPENLIDYNSDNIIVEDIERPGGGGSGTVTGGTNVGSGAGVFKDLSGADLRFKRLNSSTITITENTNDITLTYNSYFPSGW
jgi:hypothetical protein